MSRRCITFALAMLLAAGVTASSFAQSRELTDRDDLTIGQDQRTPPAQPDLSEVVQRIVQQTNAFRGEHQLSPLEENEQLTAAAQYFAQYMARTGKYGHTADGKRPSERAAEHDYQYCIVLENIAYQYSSLGFETEQSAEKFVTGWKESKGHRENMLDPDVQQIGVAVAAGEAGEYFAVQKFGRPESAKIEFAVVNQSGEEVVYQLLTSEGPKNVTLPPRATVTHTRCRPPQLRLAPPEATDEASAQQTGEEVAVHPGDRFVITTVEGELQLQRAADPPQTAEPGQ